MSISLTNEAQINSISLSFESKGHGETWADSDYALSEGEGTWDVPGVPIIEETKLNSVSLTLETKP